MPWFSSEVRDVGDQSIKWLVLDEWSVAADQGANAHLRHRDEGGHRPKPQENIHTQRRESPRVESVEKDADVAVAGHYLDHIEAVQQKDQKQKTSSKSNKRRKRQKQRNTTAARSQSSGSTKKGAETHAEPTAQAQQTKSKSKSRSRRSRPRRSKPKS